MANSETRPSKFVPRSRKVRILATLGPASRTPEMIRKLAEAGADVLVLPGGSVDGLMSLGKWLRPALCLTACEALGGDGKSINPKVTSFIAQEIREIHDLGDEPGLLAHLLPGRRSRRGRPEPWSACRPSTPRRCAA